MSDRDPHTPDSNLVLSYNAVRQALGYIGWFLPLSLLAFAQIGNHPIEASISDYYYTPMGGVLTGTLFAIGVFLVAYRGYDPTPGERLSDRWLARVAGVSALGIALLPVHRSGYPICTDTPPCWAFGAWAHPEILHYGAAIVFFACLALFSLVQFPRGERDGAGRLIWSCRAIIYLGCGTVILAVMAAILPYFLVGEAAREALSDRKYLFWCESLGIIAFATSWLTKGRAFSSLAGVARRISGRA
ncbi:MAG: hypothetical protein WA822_01915 [Albidovulum sp.]